MLNDSLAKLCLYCERINSNTYVISQNRAYTVKEYIMIVLSYISATKALMISGGLLNNASPSLARSFL